MLWRSGRFQGGTELGPHAAERRQATSLIGVVFPYLRYAILHVDAARLNPLMPNGAFNICCLKVYAERRSFSDSKCWKHRSHKLTGRINSIMMENYISFFGITDTVNIHNNNNIFIMYQILYQISTCQFDLNWHANFSGYFWFDLNQTNMIWIGMENYISFLRIAAPAFQTLNKLIST